MEENGLFDILVNFHSPGSGSAFLIQIQIQDSQVHADPDQQQWFFTISPADWGPMLQDSSEGWERAWRGPLPCAGFLPQWVFLDRLPYSINYLRLWSKKSAEIHLHNINTFHKIKFRGGFSWKKLTENSVSDPDLFNANPDPFFKNI